jgi:hypothetical protein
LTAARALQSEFIAGAAREGCLLIIAGAFFVALPLPNQFVGALMKKDSSFIGKVDTADAPVPSRIELETRSPPDPLLLSPPPILELLAHRRTRILTEQSARTAAIQQSDGAPQRPPTGAQQ